MWIPLRTNSQVFWALVAASQPKTLKSAGLDGGPGGRIKIIDFIEFLVGQIGNLPYRSTWSRNAIPIAQHLRRLTALYFSTITFSRLATATSCPPMRGVSRRHSRA